MAINQSGRVTPNAPAGNWMVTSQTETTDLDDQGRAVLGWRVYFRTQRGESGSVFIPAGRYNPLNVKAQIAPLAAHLDEVATMSGQS